MKTRPAARSLHPNARKTQARILIEHSPRKLTEIFRHSPVFLLDPVRDRTSGTLLEGTRFFFLGVLSSFFQMNATGEIVIEEVPTEQIPVVKTEVPANLGVVISASRAFDFERLIPWPG